MQSVLMIDDNLEMLEVNSSHLSDEGFDVTSVSTSVNAILYLKERQYDCIIMDVMMPDIDGFTLCQIVRALTKAPIIFLTCLDTLEDKVKGLMAGGDDYMTKPYSLQELSARIYAHLRREKIAGAHIQKNGAIVDYENRAIQTSEKRVFLSPKEFALFTMLYGDKGKVFSKKELFEAIWPNNKDIGVVAVYILKLRRKLDFAKLYLGEIQNSYNNGYVVMRKGNVGSESV